MVIISGVSIQLLPSKCPQIESQDSKKPCDNSKRSRVAKSLKPLAFCCIYRFLRRLAIRTCSNPALSVSLISDLPTGRQVADCGFRIELVLQTAGGTACWSSRVLCESRTVVYEARHAFPLPSTCLHSACRQAGQWPAAKRLLGVPPGPTLRTARIAHAPSVVCGHGANGHGFSSVL